MRVKERAPTFFFFGCLGLGPTFGSLEEFGGASYYQNNECNGFPLYQPCTYAYLNTK
jgi:hypothetical protein